MTTRLRSLRDESGMALVMAVLLTAILSLLAITLIDTVARESTRSARAVTQQTAFQAAEAGIDDYVAKLLDDRLYYGHYVHPAESTRRDSGGSSVTAGGAWDYGLTWTYPSGKDSWRPVGNGFEYNLQITPPTAAVPLLRILSTGRSTGSSTDVRVVETLIRPSSVSDFQMLANADISYGSAATTYGKIYAGIDSGGNAHDINHAGTAHGNIYAEGSVTGSPTLLSGAQTYNGSTIRSVIKNPVNFNSFLTSLVDIQRAAQVGGVNLDSPSAHAWRLTFQADGTFLQQSCTRSSGREPADAAPNCGAATTVAVPANGAIYTAQTAIVSGQVNGRVTVASNDDIVIPDHISYVQSGNDVLGLVGRNDVVVSRWSPSDLNWRAATIAQSGSWRSWGNTPTKGTMTFTGSTATNQGGYMSMFANRVYQYDVTLAYLPPPWFPVVEEAYTIVLFRELPPSS